VFCTSQSSVPTRLAGEVETQAARLRGHEPPVSFVVWDAEALAERLRRHPDIVEEFFGRAWFERFLPGEAVAATDARVFVGMITTLIATGTIVALIPGVPVIKLLVAVQVVNGVLLPITLFFVWRLSSNRTLMGEYANARTFNAVAAATVAITSSPSILLLAVTFAASLGL
jgi:hypothetical protein